MKILESFFGLVDLILSLGLEENQGKCIGSLVVHSQSAPGAAVSVIFVLPVLSPKPIVWYDGLRF